MKLFTSFFASAALFVAPVLVSSVIHDAVPPKLKVLKNTTRRFNGFRGSAPGAFNAAQMVNATVGNAIPILTSAQPHHNDNKRGWFHTAKDNKKKRVAPRRTISLGRPRRKLTRDEYRRSLSEYEQHVIEFWTPERQAKAVPLDMRTIEDPECHHHRFLLALVTVGDSLNGTDTTTEGDEEPDNRWKAGGPMQQASGRIFMMFDGNECSCSGTVIKDLGSPDRTLIATAAHCIYNEMRRYWAYDFLFIPNQDDGGNDRANKKCDDDPFGCWVPAFGVIDTDWAQNLNNIPHRRVQEHAGSH